MATGGHNLQRSFALLLADNIEQIFVAFIPSRRPARNAQTACRWSATRQSLPPIRPTSAALSEETTMRRPALMASIALGIAPGTPRNPPVRASSPTNSYCFSRVVLSCSEATRSARAMGRSYRPPSLGRSAGARLMVIFFAGKA